MAGSFLYGDTPANSPGLTGRRGSGTRPCRLGRCLTQRGVVVSVDFLQLDAGVVHQDVKPAVAPLEMPGDLLVVPGAGHVEAHGLGALDALGPELVGGGDTPERVSPNSGKLAR